MKRQPIMITINGESKTHREWEQSAGLTYGLVWHRHKMGWPVHLLLSPSGYKRSEAEGLPIRKQTVKHRHCSGLHSSVEYRTWLGMRQRCKNPRHRNFKHYGGRGITVCERWDKSFKNFLADIGLKPGPEYTLDRKDTNGNYTPENCRWATPEEQRSNRRNSVHVTIKGETKIETEWCRMANLRLGTVGYRQRAGWSEEFLLAPQGTRAKGKVGK